MEFHDRCFPYETRYSQSQGIMARDELAKAAMQSILSSSKFPLEYYLSEKLIREADAKILASNAYRIADAMIAESEK